MNLSTMIQLAQLGTIGIGFMGVLVALRSHRRQMHVQMFIEFTSRVHDVLGSMPVQIWMISDHEEEPPSPSAELTRSCLQCFHIVANLFELHKAGYVSKELWRPWQRGIRRTMQGAVLQQEWFRVEVAFSHQQEFCHYMRSLIGEKAKHPTLHGRCPHCLQLPIHPGQERLA
jgi:hypothetical protein